MLEKVYLIVIDKEEQVEVLGSALTEEQAFEIAHNLLGNNPQVKTEQIYVKEYNFKKDLKILDYQEQ